MSKLLFVSLRSGEIGPDVAKAEYADVLKATGLRNVDMELRIIDSADAELGPLDSVSGIIVGGCSLNVSDTDEAAWRAKIDTVLEQVVQSDKPVFFVCFGMSWLVHFLGGSIVRSYPENSGPTWVNLTPAGTADPLLAGFPSTFTALTGHTENPDPNALPVDLELLAHGESCPIQMVRYQGQIWATQFHAEMDAAAMQTRMDFFYDYGYFPAAEYARIVSDLPNHDVSWANLILRNFAKLCLG